jgi:hypothetical protein
MPTAWWRPAARRLAPAAVFVLFLAYQWRFADLAGRIPAYGDVLEYLWVIDWFLDGLRSGAGLSLFAPHIFMPEGWSLATFANGPIIFALALPIAALTNAAVAFNVVQLAAFFIGYFGAYRLGRLVAGQGAAILVALLYLLWGGRWLRTAGHLQMLLGSALFPWIILCLERALADRPGRLRWAAVAGLLWGLAITSSLYFIWIGFFLVAAWLAGAALTKRATWRGALLRLVVAGGAAVLLSSPYLYLYWRNTSQTVGYGAGHLNAWSMSFDWLPALFPDHRLQALREFAVRQVNGIRVEGSFSGFGILLLLLALLGVVALWRRRDRGAAGSIIVTVVAGVILGLGLTLQWDAQYVPVPALRPVNEALWELGHRLKPDVFPGADAPPEFAEAIPLPGLLLTALVPTFEGARVTARYLMVAAPALLLLAALGLERLPRAWLRWLVALLLLVEAARIPIAGVPYPPPAHAALTWLAEHPPGPGESALDITSPAPGLLTLGVGGDVLGETFIHGWPIAGGGGSILPAHAAYLLDWLVAHPDPAAAAEFPQLLRDYGIRYVLLHMTNDPAPTLQRLAAGTPELTAQGCYEPAGMPWTWPICILEVTPAALPAVNVHLAEGWSGSEPWGVWALGRESAIGWATTAGGETRFAVEAFPFCVEGLPPNQSVEFVVGDQVVAAHRWDTCDAAPIEVVVPAELVQIGWNEMLLRFGRADRPAEVTGGANPDGRELSVGFSRLERLP